MVNMLDCHPLLLLFYLWLSTGKCNKSVNSDHLVSLISNRQNNDTYIFQCTTSVKPDVCGADFLINNSTGDSIRYFDNKCHNKDGVCKPVICSCSASCLEYTWHKTTETELGEIVSCKMRFYKNTTGHVQFFLTNMLFTKQGFILHSRSNYCILVPILKTQPPGSTPKDESDFLNTETNFFIGTVILFAFTVLLASALIFIRLRKLKSKNSSVLRTLTRRTSTRKSKERFSENTMNVNQGLPNAEEATGGIEDKEYEVKCTYCMEKTNFALCITCKSFYCALCSMKHTQKKNNHAVWLLDLNSLKKGPECEKCFDKKANRMCNRCAVFLFEHCDCEHEKSSLYMKWLLQEVNTRY